MARLPVRAARSSVIPEQAESRLVDPVDMSFLKSFRLMGSN